jgi:hypothetical protein
VRNAWGTQVRVISQEATAMYPISNLSGDFLLDPTPFISSSRGGTPLSDDLHVVIYREKSNMPALSSDVSLAGL